MPDSTPPDRVQLIQNAILFLNDPKTQNSSLTSRVQFLESKGLTEKEIEQAIREAGDAGTAGVVGEGEAERERIGPSSAYGRPPERPRVPAPNYGYGYTYAPPEPPKRDWRDLFVSLYARHWHALHGQVYGPQKVKADMGWWVVDYGDGVGWCGIWSYGSCSRTFPLIFLNPSHVAYTISHPMSHNCDSMEYRNTFSRTYGPRPPLHSNPPPPNSLRNMTRPRVS